MKLSLGVLLGIAVVFSVGIYLTHQTSDSYIPNTTSTTISQLSPRAEVAPVVASDKETAGTQQEEIAALTQEVVFLRREVSALQREISTLQRQMQEQRQTNEEPSNDQYPDSLSPAEMERQRQEQQAEMERQRQEQVRGIEVRFQQESPDPHWSHNAALAVQNALAGDETAQFTLRNLQCRSRTCRVEIAGDNTSNLDEFLPLFIHQVGETLPSVIANEIYDQHGGKTMVLYMSRE